MSLRVLYSFPHRLGLPGIGMTAWHQVQGLADLGLQVILFCGSLERPLNGVTRIVETMKLGPLRLSYRAIGQDRALGWHDRRVAGFLRRSGARNVDLLHCWPSGSLTTLQVAGTLRVPRLLERPSSHTAQAYEVMEREARAVGMTAPKGHYAFRNDRRLAREQEEFQLADLLLCPSEPAARTFLDRGFAPEQLAIHQYGFDPASFSKQSANPEAMRSRPFTAVFVGECSPLKGLHVALRAWNASALAERGRLLICGKFLPGYREALAPLLAHPSVTCMGFVGDVGAVMRGCDALVHPSFSEGSALVCYEAQASGLTLVVSDAAGARCTHEVDALVHRAGDVDMLAAHLRLAASDLALIAGVRAATAARLSSLTWNHAAQRLLEIYHEFGKRRGCREAGGGAVVAQASC